MFTFPHTIENHLGEKLVFKSVEIEKGEEKVIVENFVAPGAGPTMHTHFRQEESLTVESGRMAYQLLGEKPKYAAVGETILFQRGVPHRFWNAGEEELHCIGWIKPANSIVFFLSALYNAQNASGTERPEAFDGAWLMTRYKNEYDLPELPSFVKHVVFPFTTLIGRILGKYKKFDNAPKPLEKDIRL